MPLGPRCGWTDRGLARVQQAQAGHHSRLAKALHACRRTKLGKQNSDFSIVYSIIFQGLVIDYGIEPWLQRIWRTKKRFEMVMEGEDLQKGWILCCFANFHIFVGSGWNKIRQLFHWAKPRRFELNECYYAKKFPESKSSIIISSSFLQWILLDSVCENVVSYSFRPSTHASTTMVPLSMWKEVSLWRAHQLWEIGYTTAENYNGLIYDDYLQAILLDYRDNFQRKDIIKSKYLKNFIWTETDSNQLREF